MLNKFLSFGLVGTFAVLAPMPLQASGGGGGGGGGYSGGGFSAPSGPSVPRDPNAGAYSRGQSQFKKMITCKKCAYPQGVHDSVTASKIAKRARSGEFKLSEKQQSDLMVFLQRRYGVTS